jgi:predicted transcriptional regulator
MRSENRSKIFGLICQNPGIHLREMQRALGVSFNSIRYNTEKMTSSGEIICEKSTGYSRFYPPDMSEKDRQFYSVSRNKTTFKILAELSTEPLLSNKELVARTGFAKSTISEHVHELLSANLVKLTLSEEGNFKVELQERERVRSLMAGINQSRQNDDVVQNFVELWDF